MARTVWLEVALNGPYGRALQPRIPVTPDEIVEEALACVDAGAAIVHTHAYDPDTEQPTERADVYERIFAGIRARCDAIVYPTLALEGDVEARYAPVRVLGERGLLEWGVVDPGSVNITHAMHLSSGRDGLLYANPDAHIRRGLALAAEHGWHPSFAIYEPGFARAGAAWAARQPGLPSPVYRLMLTSDFTFGLPPAPYALEAYHRLLGDVAPDAPWMLAGLGGEILGLAPEACALGAHLRVGLEDAPLGCARRDRDLVAEAVAAIRAIGCEPATPAEVRAALAR